MGGGRLKLREAVELAIEDIFRQATQSQAAANWQEDSWSTICSSRELLVKAASERSEAWSGLVRFIAQDTLLCASEMEPHGRKAKADGFGSAFDAIQRVDASKSPKTGDLLPSLMTLADAALYEAKALGRNRFETSP